MFVLFRALARWLRHRRLQREHHDCEALARRIDPEGRQGLVLRIDHDAGEG